MIAANTSYKQNGVPVSIPSGSYGIAHLTVHQYEYPKGHVATENWDEAYAGLREGYSGGYQLSGSSWSQNVTSGNVYARLQNVLGVEYEGGQYVKYSGEDLEYRLYDLHLEVENAPLAPSVPDGITQLNVTGTITVDVPLSFGFGHLPPMQITMKLNAKYVPRF